MQVRVAHAARQLPVISLHSAGPCTTPAARPMALDSESRSRSRSSTTGSLALAGPGGRHGGDRGPWAPGGPRELEPAGAWPEPPAAPGTTRTTTVTATLTPSAVAASGQPGKARRRRLNASWPGAEQWVSSPDATCARLRVGAGREVSFAGSGSDSEAPQRRPTGSLRLSVAGRGPARCAHSDRTVRTALSLAARWQVANLKAGSSHCSTLVFTLWLLISGVSC